MAASISIPSCRTYGISADIVGWRMHSQYKVLRSCMHTGWERKFKWPCPQLWTKTALLFTKFWSKFTAACASNLLVGKKQCHISFLLWLCQDTTQGAHFAPWSIGSLGWSTPFPDHKRSSASVFSHLLPCETKITAWWSTYRQCWASSSSVTAAHSDGTQTRPRGRRREDAHILQVAWKTTDQPGASADQDTCTFNQHSSKHLCLMKSLINQCSVLHGCTCLSYDKAVCLAQVADQLINLIPYLNVSLFFLFPNSS